MTERYKTSPLGTVFNVALVEPRIDDYGSRWSATMELSVEESTPLLEIVAAALDQKRASDPGFPLSNDKLYMPYKQAMEKTETGDKVPKEGYLWWNFRRKTSVVVRGQTRENSCPVLYDSTGAVITGKVPVIGSGSTGKVVFEAYAQGAKSNKGVSFALVGFQIVTLETNVPVVAPVAGGFTLEEAGPDEAGARLLGLLDDA